MSIDIGNNTFNIFSHSNFGQPPHFDISTSDFEPIRIAWGPSGTFVRSRKDCLRRFNFVYDTNNRIFTHTFTFKGVRNRKILPSSTIDATDVNNRSVIHLDPIEGNPSPPPPITQEFLHSLFKDLKHNQQVFIDLTLYRWINYVTSGRSITISSNIKHKFYGYIYRYGLVNNITLMTIFKNNNKGGRLTI